MQNKGSIKLLTIVHQSHDFTSAAEELGRETGRLTVGAVSGVVFRGAIFC